MKRRGSAPEVFLAFLRLGCLSLGGPIAHLGYFRSEFVQQRQWITEETFAEVIALAQSLPGPSSSQVGFAIGLLRAGGWGGAAAWFGFTLPSSLVMLGLALYGPLFTGRVWEWFLHGLQLMAVAVVAQAVLTMQRNLAPDRMRVGLALLAVAIVFYAPAATGTLLAIVAGALAGLLLARPTGEVPEDGFDSGISETTGLLSGGAFALLLLLSFVSPALQVSAFAVFSSFYRVGALVFGGGHVVLPLLNDAIAIKGWVTQQAFLSGYGAAQALPGPLFAFAAYLGSALRPNPHPLLYGIFALCSIFLPGLLAMTAVLPFWSRLRRRSRFQAALRGVNASVVGVLIAALYHPLWAATVHTRPDFYLALSGFALLTAWKVPPWIVAVGLGATSALLG